MKTTFVIGLMLMAFTAIAVAQPSYLPEKNEIFYKDKEGIQKIMLPPVAINKTGERSYSPMAFHSLKDEPPGNYSVHFMIETEEGLIECPAPYIEKANCRPHTIGKLLTSRTWVVRRAGVWQHCAGPTLGVECTAPPVQNNFKTKGSFKNVHVRM